MKHLVIIAVLTPSALWGAPECGEHAFARQDPAMVILGRDLFYDPILSGNRNVACATCHHPDHATSDGLSLGIGDGGMGIGPARRVDPSNPPEQRIPRNAQALFNLGLAEFSVMFHDGRLEADAARPNGLRTPLGADMMTAALSPLAAQTMFPVLSPDEMAGHYGENAVALRVRKGLLAHEDGAWGELVGRLAATPGYGAAFEAVFGRIDFAAVGEALAAFIAFEWRADDSPFDRHICQDAPLPAAAARGMALFYGAAGCADCHAGRWQTDHGFHAIAMPQIGPGKAARFESHARDEGRMRVTGRAADAYAFRTPSLRNVARTGPYGHSGAYGSLRAVVVHHLDPVGALRAYDRSQAVLPDLPGAEDFRILDDAVEVDAIAAANDLAPRDLSAAEVEDILAFLHALTDETGVNGRLGVPETVPSGLPVP